MSGCTTRVPSRLGDVPQPQEETVEVVTLIPRERVRQLTAEQIGDAPQSQEGAVDEELLVPRERVQQETAEQVGDGLQLLAGPPGIAEQPEKAAEAVDTTTGAKSVGVARPRDDVKYSATATGTTVAKPVGEARPAGIAKAEVYDRTRYSSVFLFPGPEQMM